MAITIRKIASDLNLAVSTVSKALGDSHEISAHTKKRVLDYAKSLNYVPNTYASSLKRHTTRNIAVVVPEVADSYFATAINGIESVAQQKGYHVIIYITHEDQGKEESILKEFRSGRVDGVLISVSSGGDATKHLHDLAQSKIPMIFFDRVSSQVEAPRVVTNDFESAYQATEILIRRNCRTIAFLGLAPNLSIVQERLAGYHEALIDQKLKVKDNLILFGSSDDSANIAMIHKLLVSRSRPDGIVAATEKLATQVYTVCHSLRLKIPGDVKIVAFSSMSTAPLLNPPLATITQPAFEMGKTAASMLFKKLTGKSTAEAEQIMIPSKLFDRKSAE